MIFDIFFSEKAKKQFKKIDKNFQKKIITYLENRVSSNPKNFGKALLANKKGLWRYRIEDYRVICSIEENLLIVIIIDIGHRKDIYKKQC